MALIGTLTSGVSALRTFGKGLEVIGNNIANVNTTGYKSQNASFSDTFSNTLRAASSGPGDTSMQIGTGVQVSGITTSFAQGSLSSTGVSTDLGISGNGYFVVQDLSGGNFATRDGAFHFNDSGDLVNAQGYNVLDTTGTAINVANYSQVKSISIGTDGVVTAFDSAGVPTVAGTIGLLKVPEESKLMKQGSNLYDFAATGAVIGDIDAPSNNGLGTIQSGTLELSNVDLTEQFSNLITTQRSFQAGSRLITVSDSVLEDIVNLKR